MGLKDRLLRKNIVVALIVVLTVVTCLSSAYGLPRTDIYTDVGLLGVTITNLGYVGSGFDGNGSQPSGEYPIFSNVEHLFLGGIWIGAETAGGERLVSTGAQDASTLSAGEETREYNDLTEAEFPVQIWSNRQNEDNFNSRALATQHIEVAFDDFRNDVTSHTPIGLQVVLRALAWSDPFADDFVILDYSIINVSGTELSNVYVGYWNDTTVGNTDETNPYDSQAAVGWNYYDDKNGGWGPPEWAPADAVVEGDDKIWMMWEHDDDGDDGLATSWIGTRLLGSEPAPEPAVNTPPVSYNAWAFRHVPAQDDWYTNPDEPTETLPGKYQLMGNGAFTVGETQATDYTTASDWVGLLSTGPFPSLAPNDTLHVTFAVVAGVDSLALQANSKVAQKAYDEGFTIVAGPPSPRLEFSFEDNSVIMTWTPGDSLDADGNPLPTDSALRSPEHHISETTAREDFQGYRVFRYQGDIIAGIPEEVATLVAEFDIIDGIGFDTGLPPLTAGGKRQFVDTNLLDGFPYWYSVISYSAVDQQEGLDEFRSGFNENGELVYPGPAPASASNPRTIGVYPNPYRTGSLFDSRVGEQELGRKVWFTGLAARSRVQVFTLVGELVKTIEHDDPGSGQHSWNLLSDFDRVIATGLYIYVVEDLATGEIQRGKLVIIK